MTRTHDTLVFVYGTLKRGFLNYHNYLKPAVVVDKARYLCDGVTAHPDFRLVLTPTRKVPCLYRPKNNASLDGYRVPGEIFSVDGDALRALDLLEGVDQGSYCRENIEIEISSDGPTDVKRGRRIECETYIKVFYDELDALQAIPEYGEEHHGGLIPHVKTPELRVLACVYGSQVTDRVQQKMDQGLDFVEAWKQVVR